MRLNMGKTKKKGIKLIDIIIFIIVIIVIIVAVVTIRKNKKENSNEITNQVSQTKANGDDNIQTLDNGTKLNISSKFNEDKKFGQLEFKNIQLTYKDGITNMLCDVYNTSNSKSEFQEVEIVLLGEDGNNIYTINGVINEIEAGGSTQFNTSITADFSNAYDFKIITK